VGPGVGLIETMRSRNGRLPLLERHLARLRASVTALDVPPPRDGFAELAKFASQSDDHVVRLEVREGGTEITTREIRGDRFPAVIVSSEPHAPYRHKTTDRGPFGRAFAAARRVGADDALLVTSRAYVAEGTAWSIFWWDRTGDCLCTPALELGILPSVGRARVLELAETQEVRLPVSSLSGRSLFLVNAVRGVVEIGSFQGKSVPRDPRTAELSRRFWPD
jgi:branched-subunit amino acid aminotransferase/4-amino-4-deoxychorismate lyase